MKKQGYATLLCLLSAPSARAACRACARRATTQRWPLAGSSSSGGSSSTSFFARRSTRRRRRVKRALPGRTLSSQSSVRRRLALRSALRLARNWRCCWRWRCRCGQQQPMCRAQANKASIVVRPPLLLLTWPPQARERLSKSTRGHSTGGRKSRPNVRWK